jgi:hypothetical protein
VQVSLKSPEKLDLITFDPSSSEYVLIVSATDSWDDSPEENDFLLQKINNYLDFALSGGLVEHYPDAEGRPVRIQIDTAHRIPPSVDGLIAQVQQVLQQKGIALCVNYI